MMIKTLNAAPDVLKNTNDKPFNMHMPDSSMLDIVESINDESKERLLILLLKSMQDAQIINCLNATLALDIINDLK